MKPRALLIAALTAAREQASQTESLRARLAAKHPSVRFIAISDADPARAKALAEQTRSVRIPLNQNSQLIKMSRTETYLSQELGREPTDAEIAMALEIAVRGTPEWNRVLDEELARIENPDRKAQFAFVMPALVLGLR